MKRTLTYIALVVAIFSLTLFSLGAAPQNAAAGSNVDSPIHRVWCDYDGTDAIMTPCGSVPSSHAHFLPNGSVIKPAPEGDYIYNPDGDFIEFVAKETETPSWLHRVDMTGAESDGLGATGPEETPSFQTGGWIEWAQSNYQSSLAACAADWQVPEEPPVEGGQTMALFVGIETADLAWIVQPVLAWGPSVADTDPNDWSGVAFAWHSGQSYFGSVIPCNVGDLIDGDVTYTNLGGGDQFQSVSFTDDTTGQSSLLSFYGAPVTSGIGIVTLEGYNFAGNQHVPYTTLFTNVRFFRTNHSQITWPTMLGVTDTWGVLSGLGVDVFFSGPFYARQMNIRLLTANGDTPAGGVRGHVGNAATGYPLPYSTVTVEQSGQMIAMEETDWDGQYSINLHDGTYAVTASHMGFNDKTYSVSVSGGTFSMKHFMLNPINPGPIPLGIRGT
jgi:hypothetical protein